MSQSKLVALMCPQCGAPLRSRARREYCGVLFESEDSLEIDYAKLWNDNAQMKMDENGLHFYKGTVTGIDTSNLDAGETLGVIRYMPFSSINNNDFVSQFDYGYQRQSSNDKPVTRHV